MLSSICHSTPKTQSLRPPFCSIWTQAGVDGNETLTNKRPQYKNRKGGINETNEHSLRVKELGSEQVTEWTNTHPSW